jgi:hypothetical protein
MLLIDHQVGTLNFCGNRPKKMIISWASEDGEKVELIVFEEIMSTVGKFA